MLLQMKNTLRNKLINILQILLMSTYQADENENVHNIKSR